jgi:hypothetical protein
LQCVSLDALLVIIAESVDSISAVLIIGIHILASDFRPIQQCSVDLREIVSGNLLLCFPALLVSVVTGSVRGTKDFQ